MLALLSPRAHSAGAPLHSRGTPGFNTLLNALERDFADAFYATRKGYGTSNYRWNQDDKAYVLRIDVPGFAPEQVAVSVEAEQLSVSVRAASEEGEGEELRRYRFALPVDADTEQAQAALKHGQLSVTLPKQLSAKPRQLELSTE